jgi:hypothetical protein
MPANLISGDVGQKNNFYLLLLFGFNNTGKDLSLASVVVFYTGINRCNYKMIFLPFQRLNFHSTLDPNDQFLLNGHGNW